METDSSDLPLIKNGDLLVIDVVVDIAFVFVVVVIVVVVVVVVVVVDVVVVAVNPIVLVAAPT